MLPVEPVYLYNHLEGVFNFAYDYVICNVFHTIIVFSSSGIYMKLYLLGNVMKINGARRRLNLKGLVEVMTMKRIYLLISCKHFIGLLPNDLNVLI